MADLFGVLSPADLTGFSQQVQAADPYNMIGTALASWNPNYSTMNATESGLTSFGKAFLSSLAGNYARNRTADQVASVVNILPQLATNPYSAPTPEGVDSAAFNTLRGNAILRDTMHSLYQQDEDRKTEKDVFKTILSEAVRNGTLSPERALEAAQTGKLPDRQPMNVESSYASPNSGGRGLEGNLLDEMLREANRIKAQGYSQEQAMKTAREMYETKRDELDRQYMRIEESAQMGGQIKDLTGQLRSALSRSGRTGAGGSIAQSLAGIAGWSGAEGQRLKYSAGQEVESFQNEAVKMFGRAFKGPMSDRDVQIMLRAAPSLNNEPEANEAILKRWDYAGDLQNAYSDYMRDAQNRGVPVRQAESEWSKLRANQPYLITGKDGLRHPNPFWQNFNSSGGTSGAPLDNVSANSSNGTILPDAENISLMTGDQNVNPLTRGEAVAGGLQNWLNAMTFGFGDEITSAGNAVIDTIGGDGSLGENYDSRLTQARDLRSRFREENPLSALAQDVLSLQPLTKLSKVGEATGIIGKGVQAGKEGAFLGGLYGLGEGDGGSGDSWTEDAINRAGSALGSAAVGGAVGAGTGVIAGAAGNVAQYIDELVGSQKSKSLGITSQSIKKSLKDRRVYIDEFGAEVMPSTEAELSTKLKQDINILDEDGFFNNLSNSPEKNQALFDANKANLRNELNSLREQASEALKDKHSKLSPIQQKQYPLTRNPKTGKGGISPDFSRVKSLINEIAGTDPQMKKNLTARAEKVIDNWNNSSKSWDNLQDTKALFGRATKWSKGVTSVDNAWNQVKAEINRALADRQNLVFDAVMETENPALVGKLAEVNRRFHAYSNIEPLIIGKTAKGRSSFNFSPTDVFGATERNPASAIKTGESVAKGLDFLSALGDAAAPVLSAEASIGRAESNRSINPIDDGFSDFSASSPMPEQDRSYSLPDVNFQAEDGFVDKVSMIADDLGADPNHLMAAINFETGGTFDPTIENEAGSGAVGLIQFTPATAKALTGDKTEKAAIERLKNMSATEQLDYVAKYLKPYAGKLNSMADVYMAILYPKAVGKGGDYALFRKGTKAYWQNRGLDIDDNGVITKSEASSKVGRA